jgi:thioredoxin-related protein
MKKMLLVLSLLVFSASIIAQQKSVPAKDILATACKKAAEENKKVLLIFHASWCGWCHKMDSSINNPACKKFFTDNYVITHLVVQESAGKKYLENAGADDMLKQYKAFDSGIPFWAVLDKNGNLLYDSFMKKADNNSTNIGCPATEDEVNAFVKILKQSSSITDNELSIIYKVFRKNEVN